MIRTRHFNDCTSSLSKLSDDLQSSKHCVLIAKYNIFILKRLNAPINLKPAGGGGGWEAGHGVGI